MSTPHATSATRSTHPYHETPRSSYDTARTSTRSTRPGTSAPTTGSTTQTITSTPTSSSSTSPTSDHLVLHLRGAHDPSTTTSTVRPPTDRRRSIRWAEDVIDNEGLGRKSSKVCCIYHKAREVGESSSEDDSDDSDASGGEGSDSPDDGSARMVGGSRRGKGRGHAHAHAHAHGRGQRRHNDEECGAHRRGGERKPSPNAYEKMKTYPVQKGDVMR